MSIEKCTQCKKDIDVEIEPQTSCAECGHLFCCALMHTCFADYHYDNNLSSRHTALSLLNPSWKINLRPMKEKKDE